MNIRIEHIEALSEGRALGMSQCFADKKLLLPMRVAQNRTSIEQINQQVPFNSYYGFKQTTSETESATSKGTKDTRTNSAVIGIAVGCTVVFVIFLSVLVLFCKRRKS